MRSGSSRVDLEVDDQPARGELLVERAPAVRGDQHRAEHGVERVQLVVQSTILCRSASPSREITRQVRAGVVGLDVAEEVRQRFAGRGAPSRQRPGPVDLELEERADGRGLPAGGDGPAHRSTVSFSGSIRQNPWLVVSSRRPSCGSRSSAFTYGGFFEKSTSRSERGRSAPPAGRPHRIRRARRRASTARRRAAPASTADREEDPDALGAAELQLGALP